MLINAFDYAQLTQPGGSPARASFDAYIGFLAALPAGAVDAFSPRARKALLINAYNALAVKIIVDHFVFAEPGAMASIKDIGDIFSTVWTSTAGSLAGAAVSLDDVEKGTGPLVGLLPSYRDPRIHSSVVCASVSCPDISATAFTPSNVEELLNERVSAWFTHTTKGLAVDEYGVIYASKILDWYRSDFDGWTAPDGIGNPGFRGFLQRFAPKDVADQMRGMPSSAFEHDSVQYFEYDWNLNQAPPASACEDTAGWLDPVPADGTTCAAWSGFDCHVAFDGYSSPATVLAECRETCGVCDTHVSADTVVTPDGGVLRGVAGRENAVTRQFLGIPYAAAPVGRLRWQPPEAATGWDSHRR
jgi:hypothetical protein